METYPKWFKDNANINKHLNRWFNECWQDFATNMADVGIRVDSIYYSLVDIKHGNLFAKQYGREPERLEPFAVMDAEVVSIDKFINAHIDTHKDTEFGEIPLIPTIRQLINYRGGYVDIGIHGAETLRPLTFKDTCIVMKSDTFEEMCGFENEAEMQRHAISLLDEQLGIELLWFERQVVRIIKQYNRTLYNTLRNQYTKITGDGWEKCIDASKFADVCELGKLRKVLHPPCPKGGGKGGQFIVEREDKQTVGGKYE